VAEIEANSLEGGEIDDIEGQRRAGQIGYAGYSKVSSRTNRRFGVISTRFDIYIHRRIIK